MDRYFDVVSAAILAGGISVEAHIHACIHIQALDQATCDVNVCAYICIHIFPTYTYIHTYTDW